MLVQPATAPLRHRISVTYQLRTKPAIPPLAQIRNRPRNRAKSTSVPPRLEGLRAASWIAGLEPRPTAAICYSDSIALGPFQDLAHEGLYPGKNFAVIGHEDVEEANLVSSSLSVTKVSRDEMGRQAAAALLEQIDHPGASPQRIVPKTELIVSETCGACAVRVLMS